MPPFELAKKLHLQLKVAITSEKRTTRCNAWMCKKLSFGKNKRNIYLLSFMYITASAIVFLQHSHDLKRK